MFCRLASVELSKIGPQLQQQNVRLIGVGLEELGVEEFVEKKFWAGELYIDEKQKSFKDLGYQRFSLFSLPGMLLARIARTQTTKAKEMGVGGDLKGDGFQNGGLIVVERGGKVLYSFVQQNVADHASNEDILKALNMKPEDHQHQFATEEEKAVTAAAAAQCTEDGVCKKPNSPP